jgi:hypothetical protein
MSQTDNLEVKNYNKIWYEKNKESHKEHMKEKVNCIICGINITRSIYYRHLKTKKHLNFEKIYNELKKSNNDN